MPSKWPQSSWNPDPPAPTIPAARSHRQGSSLGTLLPAMLSLPSGHPLWGVYLQNTHPERGICPAPPLPPQMVTSASCQPVSSPGDAANPSPYQYQHILEQVFLCPTLLLGFGVQIPPFFRSEGSKFKPLMQEAQVTSPPTCFIFHCTAAPWP